MTKDPINILLTANKKWWEGVTITGTAKDLGCDPEGGKWVNICVIHGTIGNYSSRKDALACRSSLAGDLCEACTEMHIKMDDLLRYLKDGPVAPSE
jgi:hypothetical protein